MQCVGSSVSWLRVFQHEQTTGMLQDGSLWCKYWHLSHIIVSLPYCYQSVFYWKGHQELPLLLLKVNKNEWLSLNSNSRLIDI